MTKFSKEWVLSRPYPLLQELPKGSILALSQEFGLNRNSIRQILKGRWDNSAVVEAAVRILEERTEVARAIIAA